MGKTLDVTAGRQLKNLDISHTYKATESTIESLLLGMSNMDIEVLPLGSEIVGTESNQTTDAYFSELNEQLEILHALSQSEIETLNTTAMQIVAESVDLDSLVLDNSFVVTPIFTAYRNNGILRFALNKGFTKNHSNRWIPIPSVPTQLYSSLNQSIEEDKHTSLNRNRKNSIVAKFAILIFATTAVVAAIISSGKNSKAIVPGGDGTPSKADTPVAGFVEPNVSTTPFSTLTSQPDIIPSSTPIIDETPTANETPTPAFITYETLTGGTIELPYTQPKLLPYIGKNGLEYRPVTTFTTYEDLGKYIAFVTGNFGSIGNNPPLSPENIVETSELAWNTHIKIVNQGFEMFIETTEGRIKVIVGLSTEGEGTIVAYTDAKKIRRAIFLNIAPELANEELQKGIDLR